MKKYLLIILAIGFLGIILNGCKKDETPDPTPTVPTNTVNKALLYDKWWYPSDGSVISDMYYHSNGSYEQVYSTMQASGTWNWVNNTDTMFITSPQAGDWYQVFTEISDHSMSFKLSLDNWAKEYKYADTQ